MKFTIKHEIKNRMRIHVSGKGMSCRQADILLYYLSGLDFVTSVKVKERTQDVIINYIEDRDRLIDVLRRFQYEKADVPEAFLENSVRKLNQTYSERLITQAVVRIGCKYLLPKPWRVVQVVCRSIRYFVAAYQSLKRKKIEVSVLDAMAIGVSFIRRDMETASSIMFMLSIGETLEEWTHKKSVNDLARSMSLNVENVWVLHDGQEILVPAQKVKVGDRVVVHMGNLIPFDGVVETGEAMVNQSSLTGESIPVYKSVGVSVYAGTVVEEGELTILVKEVNGSSKFEKIVTMIEETEKLKSSVEGKAEHLADKLVPYTLAGAALTWLFSRNVDKAVSVLMVDFSCALKLAMPISVLSAIREASVHKVTVKGGKYLEAIAEADTIVFDKTGTITEAKPTVIDVISFNGEEPDELLRIAACLEEHFPHSMAKAVVDAAREKDLIHEELHSKVEYLVAHGISTTIGERKAVIGSYHFVFEDEKCVVPEEMKEKFESLPKEYTHLYLAIENTLVAVICIEDPLREEAKSVIHSLREFGIKKVVMMTGDSEHIASVIAKRIGVDEYYSEVLPEDKAGFVEREKKKGSKVIMIGDGINDSPALSASDVGIAISDGAEIAREVSDITIGADNLYEIVTLKQLSNALMKRIQKNYKVIVGFNTMLIVLGVMGVISPTTSALLHNTSTLTISLKSMENLLK